jgi:hypothetical protein
MHLSYPRYYILKVARRWNISKYMDLFAVCSDAFLQEMISALLERRVETGN